VVATLQMVAGKFRSRVEPGVHEIRKTVSWNICDKPGTGGLPPRIQGAIPLALSSLLLLVIVNIDRSRKIRLS